MFFNDVIGKCQVDVNIGEIKASREKIILRSIAIGSCVVVAAIDFKNQIGAFAHIMMPGHAPENEDMKTKYASDAIEAITKSMFELGSNKNDINVVLVGGGNVLELKDCSISQDNIDSAIEILKKYNLNIVAQALGGNYRRGVWLDIETGCISYTEADNKEKLLWQPPENNS